MWVPHTNAAIWKERGMLTARNPPRKHNNLILTLRSSTASDPGSSSAGGAIRGMDVLWAKVTSQLMKLQNRELDCRIQIWKSYGSIDCSPLSSLAFPSIPHRTRKCRKMGLWEASTGWYKKEDKVLIPETPKWTLTKSLPDATHYGRGALWDLMQKGFYREGV